MQNKHTVPTNVQPFFVSSVEEVNNIESQQQDNMETQSFQVRLSIFSFPYATVRNWWGIVGNRKFARSHLLCSQLFTTVHHMRTSLKKAQKGSKE